MNPASAAGHVLELLQLTDRGDGPADRIVSTFLRERRYLGSRDRRLISDFLYGIIRHRRYLEALLEEFLRRHPGWEALDEPGKRYVPLLVLHAVTNPGTTPDARGDDDPPWIATIWTPHFPDLAPSEFTSWARKERDLGYLDETPAVTLGVAHSFQDWMTEEWLGRWPEEAEALLAALNRPGPVCLRVNTLKTDRAACRERLAAEGIEAADLPSPDTALAVSKRFNQNASPAFKEGWYEIQDAGSQMVSLSCAVAPGQTVVDACAGAGGKTLHLAALMENRGRIVAVDTDPVRLKELRIRASRAGVTIASAVSKKEFDPAALTGKADAVLVDAPCSGSGTIRRNPSLKWRVSPEDVARYAARQASLLRFHAPLVRPGGRLVYSTCSLFRAENEEVIEAFLASDSGFRPVAEPRTLLPHRDGTDGFFIAALERTG